MNSDDEYKQNTIHKEAYSPTATDNNVTDFAYDQIEEKRLVRKIDWRLLPILGALYSIALIDRTNVSLDVSHSHLEEKLRRDRSPMPELLEWVPISTSKSETDTPLSWFSSFQHTFCSSFHPISSFERLAAPIG
jgi:hypothetical protein